MALANATYQLTLLTIICYIRDLEPFPTVTLIGSELDPQLLGARGEGDGSLVCLARFISCH